MKCKSCGRYMLLSAEMCAKCAKEVAENRGIATAL